MIKFLNEILINFRSCFSRKATFDWFVVIVSGLLIRTDNLGVTSVIRALMLIPNYIALIGFFRSKAWCIDTLVAKWCESVKKYAPLAKHSDSVILVGDGVKKSKEGRRMPGVKRHHQESENSSKAEYIFGHMFGGVGILAEKAGKCFCIPLILCLQDGVKKIFGWNDINERQDSHIVEMIRLACNTAKHFGKAILLLDRLFLSVSALEELDKQSSNGKILNIVTKAKSNCKAYKKLDGIVNKRGRKRKKGKTVKVSELFESKKDEFKPDTIILYGKSEQVRYYHIDLLWGAKLYKELRFVLVEYNNTKSILVSTDLTMEPVEIIQLYGKRFNIETTFREMKQVICSFGYRFWSKYMPKLNRFRKKTDPDPIDQVDSKRARKRITLAIKATEGFVFCGTVAIGLLQILSLKFSGTIELKKIRFMRTYRNCILSEATIADFLRKNFFYLLSKHPYLTLTRIITSKQYSNLDENELPLAS
jgi:hypothetical protein